MERRAYLGRVPAVTAVALAGCLGSGNQEAKDELLSTYEEGYRAFEDGSETYDEASDKWNNGNQSAAKPDLETTEGEMSTAESKFSACVEMTYQIEASETRDICDESLTSAELMATAAETLITAAEQHAEGNYDRRDELVDEARSRIQEAKQHKVRHPDVVEETLE